MRWKRNGRDKKKLNEGGGEGHYFECFLNPIKLGILTQSPVIGFWTIKEKNVCIRGLWEGRQTLRILL